MTNHFKWMALAAVIGAFAAGEAQAVAINRCVKLMQHPQVNRQALVNTCQSCRTVKVERTRPGSATDTPSIREYNMPAGTSMPLPFMGTGKTRISGDTPCPPDR